MAQIPAFEPFGESGDAAGGREPRRGMQPDELPGRDGSPGHLARLIEGEIIPRLLLAHRDDPGEPLRRALPAGVVAPGEADAFAPLTLRLEVFELLGHIDAVLARGVAIETVLTHLLAPAARRLGEFWEEDICDFVDVTMGLWRIQQLVHELGARASLGEVPQAEHRALFALTDGDQHTLGLVIIEEFFRRAGWDTASAPGVGTAELADLVSKRWFELIGITATLEEHMARLPALIAALRAASRNPAVRIMVGGRLFSADPERAAAAGADGTAPDGPSAVRRAEALVAQRLPLPN